jgi:hypothetical protein
VAQIGVTMRGLVRWLRFSPIQLLSFAWSEALKRNDIVIAEPELFLQAKLEPPTPRNAAGHKILRGAAIMAGLLRIPSTGGFSRAESPYPRSSKRWKSSSKCCVEKFEQVRILEARQPFPA